VDSFLLDLAGTKLDVVRGDDGNERARTFDDVVKDLVRYVEAGKYRESLDKMNVSLLRLRIDQIVYTGSQSLATIFVRIYQRTQKHAFKDMLLERLVEELIDMADTCSSGHANRLVNVFSGVDGFIMDIGWRSQIESNISGRLTAKARVAIDKTAREKAEKKAITYTAEELKVIDEKFRDAVLEQMTSDKVEERLEFHAFFRDCIGGIREEMKREFVPAHVTEDEFELMFRQGLNFYETGVREA
jgi:hypothetical protein